MPILLFLLTVISRVPFTSRYIYHSDSGHFILGMKHYDVLLHQPHPPGYFLYVMLGRACNLVVPDAHFALVILSMIFSGLTVVTIYYLGREIFDVRTGIFAALLALTSPNFWFNGELALTYAIEAFFSAFIGLLCWRVLNDKKGYLWFSIAALALAGGFRQNTPFFLFPLWFYSSKKEPIGKIITALVVFSIICLSWFLPMILLTGGIDSYLEAFRELMRFNTGHVSVAEKGLPALRTYTSTLHSFIAYTLGAALPCALLALYALVRNRELSLLKSSTSIFFAFWLVPSLLFYLLFFIHQDNPGYVLLLLPSLALVAAKALLYLGTALLILTGKNIDRILFGLVVLVNAAIFLFSHNSFSRFGINEHDHEIGAIINNLGNYNPKNTIFLVGPYTFYSYRHLMVYLPEFTVYQVDTRTSSTGQKRKLFGGANTMGFTTDTLTIPKGINSFAAIAVADDRSLQEVPPKLSITRVTQDFAIVSGNIRYLLLLYPELRPYVENQRGLEETSPGIHSEATSPLPRKGCTKHGSPQ